MPVRRHFPPPWSVEELDACFVVRDHNGQQLAYVYFEDERGRRSAAKLLSKDEARRIAGKYPQATEKNQLKVPFGILGSRHHMIRTVFLRHAIAQFLRLPYSLDQSQRRVAHRRAPGAACPRQAVLASPSNQRACRRPLVEYRPLF